MLILDDMPMLMLMLMLMLILMQVNYIQYDGRDLEQSAWCSMPYNEEV